MLYDMQLIWVKFSYVIKKKKEKRKEKEKIMYVNNLLRQGYPLSLPNRKLERNTLGLS